MGGLLEANWLKITMATGNTISSQPVFLNPVRMNRWLSGKDFLWYINAASSLAPCGLGEYGGARSLASVAQRVKHLISLEMVGFEQNSVTDKRHNSLTSLVTPQYDTI